MSNRADRRRVMREEGKKSQALLNSYTREKRMAGLIQNGITPEDVKRSYREGFVDGAKESTMPMFKAVYAALCLALHEIHGFGAKRCMDVLAEVQERLLWALGHEELIDDVFRDIGLTIRFEDEWPVVEEKK